ncbi:hypothetical protein NKJ90_28945 [Mesorhizobium sp. M0051]|nr:hypothetical protein [Mesorhizobium sp. LNHC252B00]ESY74057.1 hypothetical protein X743_08700 [Mesorhizobium sp. LNHC252B00]
MPLRYSAAVRGVETIHLLLVTGADPAFETRIIDHCTTTIENAHRWL